MGTVFWMCCIPSYNVSSGSWTRAQYKVVYVGYLLKWDECSLSGNIRNVTWAGPNYFRLLGLKKHSQSMCKEKEMNGEKKKTTKKREKESCRKSSISLRREEDTWKRWKDRKTKNWLTTKKTQQEASKTEATLKDNQTSKETGPACQSYGKPTVRIGNNYLTV